MATRTTTKKAEDKALDIIGVIHYLTSPEYAPHMQDGKFNVRAAGVDILTAKKVAKETPSLFGYETVGAWPKIWLKDEQKAQQFVSDFNKSQGESK